MCGVDVMNSFDEWYREAKKLNNDGFSAKDFFEAGQQSKQAKVDELQKRIDDLKNFCIKGIESNMLSIEYNQALIDMHNILKGNTNDH